MHTMRSGRYAIVNIVEDFPPDSVMVEVGSYRGESAQIFLNSGKIKHLYCVDPWETTHLQNIKKAEQCFDNIFKECPSVTKIKNTSVEAAKQFQDKSLDIVYIDAMHDYDSVKQDILTWLPKIKPNGIISGHDYEQKRYSGLTQAVDEIFGKPHKVYIDDTSWLVFLGEYEPEPVRTYITCVHYADYLRYSLPTTEFLDPIIITSEEDKETQQVAIENGCDFCISDAWGRTFSKSSALNEVIDYSGWVLLLDADILLPGPFPILDDKERIYGVNCRWCKRFQDFGKSWKEYPYRGTLCDNRPAGFFQLWWGPYEDRNLPHSPNAATYDRLHGQRFKKYGLIPNYEALHIGETTTNWNGRKTKRWGDENIIYSVAVGPEYTKMAQIMVNSLRRVGWNGPIYIFSNGKIEDATVIFFDGTSLAAKYKRSGVWLDQPFDCKKALYCDVDIVWKKHPDVLFHYVTDKKSFYAFDEGLILDRDKAGLQRYFTQELNRNEIDENHLGYNSGLVCAHRRTWRHGAKYWKQRNKRATGDQVAFNREYIRGNIKVTSFPKEWISFHLDGLQKSSEPVLEHFLGVKNQQTIADMYHCLDNHK